MVIGSGQVIQELSYLSYISQQDSTTPLICNAKLMYFSDENIMFYEQFIIHRIQTGGASPILFRQTLTRLKLITSLERTCLHTFCQTQSA